MKDAGTPDEHALRFFATPPHACSYLEQRQAVSVFADPEARLDMEIYARLAPMGFRRSGGDLYIPSCPACERCIPLRVMATGFEPDRSQRRVRKRNPDVRCTPREARFREEHFELYRRYLGARHAGGGMDDPTPEDYMRFVASDWSDTLFLELRLPDRHLLGVAVTDCLPDALSAVYTFFDPRLDRRSPGILAVLMQLELARQLGLDWLYLGYWIPECRKMRYKARFRPFQILRNGRWRAPLPEDGLPA
ncbi:MAG TPA: arginyltransferase [Gammaproteobacteria bacterium]|nr:arginyltransferase [Gammaproteobacteria bacterium]